MDTAIKNALVKFGLPDVYGLFVKEICPFVGDAGIVVDSPAVVTSGADATEMTLKGPVGQTAPILDCKINNVTKFSVTSAGQASCTSVNSTGDVACTTVTASGAVGCASVVSAGDVGCTTVTASGAVGCASVVSAGTVQTGATGLKIGAAGPTIDYGAAAPVAGAWVHGSIRYNSGMAVGAPIGWACTVAGTPGTWVALANL